jgi:hypothetical protein
MKCKNCGHRIDKEFGLYNHVKNPFSKLGKYSSANCKMGKCDCVNPEPKETEQGDD